MTTRDYLTQIERFERILDNKQLELLRLRDLASSVSSFRTGDKVMRSGSKDKLGDSVSRIVDLEKDVSEKITAYADLRQKIIEQIEHMEDMNHYSILFRKYVERQGFEQIAEALGYSQRQIIRIHQEALQVFEKMYGKEYLSCDVIECHTGSVI